MNDQDIYHVIRIVTASALTEQKAELIAQKFSEHFQIKAYSVVQELDSALLGGFIIFAGGYRYDYSVKGQLNRVAGRLKAEPAISASMKNKDENVSETEFIYQSIENILADFDEAPTVLQGQDIHDLFDSVIAEKTDDSEKHPIDRMREQVENSFSNISGFDEIGQVQSISDGIAIVQGIEHCLNNELIVFSDKTHGLVMNLEEEGTGIVLLGDGDDVVEGSFCKRTGRTISIPVSDDILGRVVDALGNPVDKKGAIRPHIYRPVEYPAPGIISRSPVNEPLQTGITAIDAMTPVGKGQRELIIGDRQTGKTTIALDTILNQKNKNVLCVYVAIGQKMSTVAQFVQTLEIFGAIEYTTVVTAGAGEAAALQYLAPYTGCAIAEYFMYDQKKDVLIIYDDLSKHAQAYRAISLLLRRPPGREAYPGDVFYLHSRLLERAAKLNDESGGGSITALPVIETQGGDISAYIPTNVISITDGQIYLESELFFSGQRPAINVGLSVSRVGGAAQTRATKKVAGPLRIHLAQAREMAAFAQFGSDLDENTQILLKRGQILNEVLKQPPHKSLAMEEQVVILHAASNEAISFLKKEDIHVFMDAFLENIQNQYLFLLQQIAKSGEFPEELQIKVNEAIEDFIKIFIQTRKEYAEVIHETTV